MKKGSEKYHREQLQKSKISPGPLKMIHQKIILIIFLLVAVTPFALKAQCSNLRYIKINVHFMLKSDGTGNYNEYDNGKIPADSTQNGFWYAQNLIDNSNYWLANNQPMFLPYQNTTPNPPTNIRLALSGVYFHRDDNNYVYTISNRSSSRANDIYGVNKKSEMNIFIQNNIGSSGWGGIACGLGYKNGACNTPWIKLVGAWTGTLPDNGNSPYNLASSVNHEMGHILGLGHTFSQERNVTGKVCGDTPANSSHWCGVSAINGGTNNMMDYNCQAYAITPCQLEIMQNSLDTYYKNFVVCCPVYPVTALAYIGSQVCNNRKIILDGLWRSQKSETGYTIEIFKTDSSGSQNNLGKYYSQEFSGQYGLIDLSQLYRFVPGFFYKVKLTVTGESCNGSDSEEAWIKIDNSKKKKIVRIKEIKRKKKKRKKNL